MVTTAAVGLAVQVWLGPALALSAAVAAVLLPASTTAGPHVRDAAAP
ncbi:hypothetical protein OG985_04355 [Streptomyces sp. NBC_00289]